MSETAIFTKVEQALEEAGIALIDFGEDKVLDADGFPQCHIILQQLYIRTNYVKPMVDVIVYMPESQGEEALTNAVLQIYRILRKIPVIVDSTRLLARSRLGQREEDRQDNYLLHSITVREL